MEIRKKITRLKLDLPDDEMHYQVFGLATSEPDYTLALAINRSLGINLKKVSPLELSLPRAGLVKFSRFSDLTESPDHFCTLVANRSKINLILQKYSQIGFLLINGTAGRKPESAEIINSLRTLHGITAAFKIKEDEIDLEPFIPH